MLMISLFPRAHPSFPSFISIVIFPSGRLAYSFFFGVYKATERFRHLSYCIDAIGRSGFLPAAQAGSDRALARTAVIESGTERLHFNSINDVYFVSAKAKYITERKGDRGA
ncbi:hypothetical protein NitaMp143 (mitochondrion) [Nicotiana tabacum]|uniref:Uncharacterized protein n=1 Tax=Nicotiana tabacum TaxID=4097 RepID=Q5M9T2_TOBAC|nr:hypothetical protein NitaMp143 [Nicotiana tabacum]BAD83546.1 hypothetical protein [Nicotiana tabacum]